MNQEVQSQEQENTELELVSLAPLNRVPYTAVTSLASLGLLEMMGAGGYGLVGATVAGLAAWFFSDDIRAMVRHVAPTSLTTHRVFAQVDMQDIKHRLLFGADTPRMAPETITQSLDTAIVESNLVSGATPQGKTEPIIRRLTVDEIVSHMVRNNYQTCIGRSLTQPNNPPIIVNIKKKHFKFIGASQKGKSSMAAAFLDIVTRTHDTSHVLVALLDLEDSTSKLFTALPHIAQVTIENTPILLHARNREQVIEYLGYIVQVMNERYTLTKTELEQEPILFVYVEEFLSLKNYYKGQYTAAPKGEKKEKARREYVSLVDNITELAERGLKARVQLVLCAQVSYADEDFREALANVEAGMSFCVRPSASQAAGFMDYDLLKRNALDNIAGQAVAQMADCNDLVLAPDYDLENRIKFYEQSEEKRETPGTARREGDGIKISARGVLREQRVHNPTPQTYYTPQGNERLQETPPVYASVNEKTPVYDAVYASVNVPTSQLEGSREQDSLRLPINVNGSVSTLETTEEDLGDVNVNADKRETIRRMLLMRKAGSKDMTDRAISECVRLDGPKYKYYTSVRDELLKAMEA